MAPDDMKNLGYQDSSQRKASEESAKRTHDV